MRVLIALDESECSEYTIDFLTSRPWMPSDRFMIVSVVEPLPAEVGVGMAPSVATSYIDNLEEICSEVASMASTKIADRLPDNTVESKVLRGFIADQICAFATSWNADLIVVGSHGRKGFQRFLLGSVAEEVLKSAPCSVEVVKGEFQESAEQSSNNEETALSK